MFASINKKFASQDISRWCLVPPDSTIMEFDVNGLYRSALHRWLLSSVKLVSSIPFLDPVCQNVGNFSGLKKVFSICRQPAMDIAARRSNASPTQAELCQNVQTPASQCSQFWQVSAKYYCFLDFIAPFCAIYSLCKRNHWMPLH